MVKKELSVEEPTLKEIKNLNTKVQYGIFLSEIIFPIMHSQWILWHLEEKQEKSENSFLAFNPNFENVKIIHCKNGFTGLKFTDIETLKQELDQDAYSSGSVEGGSWSLIIHTTARTRCTFPQ